MEGTAPRSLEEVVSRARRLGLTSRAADPTAEIGRCAPFVEALRTDDTAPIVDLGSGNGLPGLVVATALPRRVLLVEASAARCDFLRWAVAALDLADRVEVVEGTAEMAGRDPDLRGRAGSVIARSFGPPATTVECAVGFLSVGGRILVAEPPAADPTRWPEEGLAELGLVDRGPRAGGLRELVVVAPVDDRWPRAAPRPRRTPLFG